MADESGSGYEPDEGEETEWLFPSNPRSGSADHDDDSSTAEPADADDRVAAFESVAFGVDHPPESPTESDRRPPTQSAAVPAFLTHGSAEDTPRARRSRKWIVVGAAIVALVVVGAVGVVAALQRGDGTTPSSRPAAPITGETPASTSPCNGRDCDVAVRERPSVSAKQVGALHTGDVAQVTCSAQGDSVDDRDTGQRSDVWYRLAGINGYSSSLYLQGPAVAACG